MDQALHHGLKVLVLLVHGDGETATATVGAACYGSWEVAVADLVPLDPPHHDRVNGREEREEEKSSYRRHHAAERERAGRGEYA